LTTGAFHFRNVSLWNASVRLPKTRQAIRVSHWLFQLALLDEQCAVDHQGADDQHRGGAVNTAYSDLMTGDVDDPWIDFEDDEKQQERDEIDELFHSGSQKQDVAA
jgi:hypothetical protein